MISRGVVVAGNIETSPRPWQWTSPTGVTSHGSRVQLAAGGCFWAIEVGALPPGMRDALGEDDAVVFRVNRIRPGRNGILLADATDVLDHDPAAK